MSKRGGRYINAAEAAFLDAAWRYFRFRNDRAAGRSILENADKAWRNAVQQDRFAEKAAELVKERNG